MVTRDLIILAVAAFAAGVVNAIAGGGTLITFSALLSVGRDAVIANATSTVAIWPGSLGGAFGFRRELASARRWVALLIVPSLAGGILGAVLLLRTPSQIFERIVPLLILMATILLALQEVISRHLPARSSLLIAVVVQFLVGVYGGYFGAGIGILMLAVLGLIGLTDLHQMNGLKNVLAIAINGVAAIYFAANGAVAWRDAGVMAIAAVIGGLAGARLARSLGRNFVRGTVVAIGVVMTVVLLIR